MPPADTARLIQALQNPAVYPHPTGGFEVLETHISWVVLTGGYAYKIKKPVQLGFLDFSTLELRKFYCEEELRLNRRYAPQIYLEVVAITGEASAPTLNGAGPVLEYAVKMREFPQQARLDRVLARGELDAAHIDALARELADFHARIALADAAAEFGSAERVQRPVRENFRHIKALLTDPGDLSRLDRIESWCERQHALLAPVFERRKRDGCVRECHGDLHLGNMALLGSDITFFDCIEFNESLRWIDVMSDVAFVTMDLRDRGRGDFAARLLNGYLELTGDYTGLQVLRYYQVYRAMVRAKVAMIRLSQADMVPGAQQKIMEEFRGYLSLALESIAPAPARLLITCGLSGAGKTTWTTPLLEQLPAVRVRSDIERKRMHGLPPAARTAAGAGAGIYDRDSTEAVYARLAELAQVMLAAGHAVIVDATFLRKTQRHPFAALARSAGVDFTILHFTAAEQTLRARVCSRAQAGTDASEANLTVLDHQLAAFEPLDADERAQSIGLDTEGTPDIERVLALAGAERGSANGNEHRRP